MTNSGETLGLAPWLLDLLRCPLPHHAEIRVATGKNALECTECGALFPVEDGLPIMLVESSKE